MRIIGDVHGYYNRYLKLIKDCPSSVQVGDFGFEYDCLKDVDPNLHKIVGGNHDNYDTIGSTPHYLGDFGVVTVDGVTFFFVRGELSVDRYWRTEGVNWWQAEELGMQAAYEAVQAYIEVKPEIVISHGCPASLLPVFVTNDKKMSPSRTAQMLEAMYEAHLPKLWVFGHHHRTWKLVDGDCTFQCLGELATLDI